MITALKLHHLLYELRSTCRNYIYKRVAKRMSKQRKLKERTTVDHVKHTLAIHQHKIPSKARRKTNEIKFNETSAIVLRDQELARYLHGIITWF